MKIRKMICFLMAACMFFGLTACRGADEESLTPTEVTKNFFSAFASSDYETMKPFCTDSCVQTYFHDGDVYGMVWAKLVQADEEKIVDDHIVNIFATVEMETAETSALYPETETSFYVELVRDENDAWQINSFFTG